MKRVTNTQQLKVGTLTNMGEVKIIHDNKAFTSNKGWCHSVDTEAVYLSDHIFQKEIAEAQIDKITGSLDHLRNTYLFTDAHAVISQLSPKHASDLILDIERLSDKIKEVKSNLLNL